MTHEQKPESADFRARDEQIGALALAMDAAYPRTVAKIHISEAEARGAAEQRRKDAEIDKDRLANLIEGMEVSVDVSTCDEDAGNRLFGTVTVAQEYDSAKNGLILLVQEPEPNFNKRRKDAEGAEQPTCYVNADRLRWHLSHGGSYMTTVSAEPVKASVPHHNLQDGLYLRPANVAALEARVRELEGERVKAISRLRSQIVGYRKTQHSRIAKSLARTLHVVYGEIYRDSDFEHVAVVEDMLRERAEAAERRIAEAVAAEREKIAARMAEVAKHLAHPWGSHLTEEGIAVKEACAARVEQEAAAIREGGEHG